MNKTGKLYLIPNIIAEANQEKVIPTQVKEVLKTMTHFVVEDVRTARRYLSSLKIFESIEALHFQVLNKDTKEEELGELLKPLKQGYNVGVISESGCPGVADPGALAVGYAHHHNIHVVPLVGPSSILLALMASGLNGQKFAFHGYLPIDANDAGKAIKALESESRSKNQTQIFIETPYRNNSLLDHLLKHLHLNTKLSIGIDITGAEESIQTKEIKAWAVNKPSLGKVPAVFSFLAQ
jgi:16S rRNA (cytidine1402-2'-O)-methyltransferase